MCICLYCAKYGVIKSCYQIHPCAATFIELSHSGSSSLHCFFIFLLKLNVHFIIQRSSEFGEVWLWLLGLDFVFIFKLIGISDSKYVIKGWHGHVQGVSLFWPTACWDRIQDVVTRINYKKMEKLKWNLMMKDLSLIFHHSLGLTCSTRGRQSAVIHRLHNHMPLHKLWKPLHFNEKIVLDLTDFRAD